MKLLLLEKIEEKQSAEHAKQKKNFLVSAWACTNPLKRTKNILWNCDQIVEKQGAEHAKNNTIKEIFLLNAWAFINPPKYPISFHFHKILWNNDKLEIENKNKVQSMQMNIF